MLNFSPARVTICLLKGWMKIYFSNLSRLPRTLLVANRVRRVYEKSFIGFGFMPYKHHNAGLCGR